MSWLELVARKGGQGETEELSKTELWWVFKGISDAIADSDLPVQRPGGVGREPDAAMCGWGDGQYFGIGCTVAKELSIQSMMVFGNTIDGICLS